MLDYDAMRSKVKKLVEKPDKDPGKLPRTEKECEMVSMNDFLHQHEDNCSASEPDLDIPSPPKALESAASRRVQELQQEDLDVLCRHSGIEGMRRSSSLMAKVSGLKRRSIRLGAGPDPSILQRSAPSAATAGTSAPYPVPPLRESSTDALLQRPTASHFPVPSPDTFVPINSDARFHYFPREAPSMISPISLRNQTPDLISIASSIGKRRRSRDSNGARSATPFFHPSELEKLMQPLREEFLHSQTDKLAQAKAAYEQLNEQLTNELPQLIDLR